MAKSVEELEAILTKGKYEEALIKIVNWELPKDYELNHGSKGAREFIRDIAREALK